jgi:hypothetical protein
MGDFRHSSNVSSDSESGAVNYILLDYREIALALGTLDAKSFVAGYRDHERWREGERNPGAGLAVLENVRALWARQG